MYKVILKEYEFVVLFKFRNRWANIFQYLFRLLQILSNAHSFR